MTYDDDKKKILKDDAIVIASYQPEQDNLDSKNAPKDGSSGVPEKEDN